MWCSQIFSHYSQGDFPTDGETTDANSNTATVPSVSMATNATVPSVSMTTNAVVTTDPAISTDNTDTAGFVHTNLCVFF
jgi:hypothetical protein